MHFAGRCGMMRLSKTIIYLWLMNEKDIIKNTDIKGIEYINRYGDNYIVMDTGYLYLLDDKYVLKCMFWDDMKPLSKWCGVIY